MPRDYKHTSQRKQKPSKPFGVDSWDRVLIVVFVLVASLWVKSFLTTETNKEVLTQDPQIKKAQANQISESTPKLKEDSGNELIPYTDSEEYKQLLEENPDEALEIQSLERLKQETKPKEKEKPKEPIKPAKQDKEPEEPHFDFYTILPSVEVVIPEHEIKTRVREEKLAQKSEDPPSISETLNAKYIMQAGSFRNFSDAIALQTRLHSMGIESRLERAQVGEAIWTRVKIGPYTGMTTIMAIKTRLKENGIDVLVLEFND